MKRLALVAPLFLTIEYAAELDALPVGSVVRNESRGLTAERIDSTHGAVIGVAAQFDWRNFWSPGSRFIVLYRPDRPVQPTVPDDFADHYGHLPVLHARVADIIANYLTGDERTWDQEAADLDITSMLESVARDGVLHPVTLGTDGRVLDGHHRLLAARDLGIETIPVRLAPMPALPRFGVSSAEA